MAKEGFENGQREERIEQLRRDVDDLKTRLENCRGERRGKEETDLTWRARISTALEGVGKVLNDVSASQRAYEAAADSKIDNIYATIRQESEKRASADESVKTRLSVLEQTVKDLPEKIAVKSAVDIHKATSDLASVRVSDVARSLQEHKDACAELRASQTTGLDSRVKALESSVKEVRSDLVKLAVKVSGIASLVGFLGGLFLAAARTFLGKFFAGGGP